MGGGNMGGGSIGGGSYTIKNGGLGTVNRLQSGRWRVEEGAYRTKREQETV